MSPVKSATYLAFDFGTKRIGIAVGDTVTRSARPLTALPSRNGDWRQIDAIVAEWQPLACIVGLPLNDDGGEQTITRLAREFATALQSRFPGRVHLCDERYSSKSAHESLRNARADGSLNRRLRPGDKDSAAACLILEQWLTEGCDQDAGRAQG